MASCCVDDRTCHPLAEFCNCAIHLGLLNDPKLLPCGHSFCLECLQTTHQTEVNKGHLPANQVKCPLCCALYVLPQGSVNSLPMDFKSKQLIELIIKEQRDVYVTDTKHVQESQITDVEEKDQQEVTKLRMCTVCKQEGTEKPGTIYCINCKDMLCQICNQQHHENETNKDHVLLKVSDESFQNILCIAHNRAFISRYCITCSTPICNVCALKTHSTHQQANLINNKKHETERSSQINGNFELEQTIRLQCDSVREALSKKKKFLDDIIRNQQVDQMILTTEVDDHINKLIAHLEKERGTLHVKVDSFYHDNTLNNGLMRIEIDSLMSRITDLINKLEIVTFPLGQDFPVSIASDKPLIQLTELCQKLDKEDKMLTVQRPICQFKPSDQHAAGSVEIRHNELVESPSARLVMDAHKYKTHQDQTTRPIVFPGQVCPSSKRNKKKKKVTKRCFMVASQ